MLAAGDVNQSQSTQYSGGGMHDGRILGRFCLTALRDVFRIWEIIQAGKARIEELEMAASNGIGKSHR